MEISTILDSLGDLRYADLYIVGDLNMDHTPDHLTENTQSLISIMRTNGLSQVISAPTRRTATTSTLLDIMYVKTKKELHPYTIKTSMSDHYLVGCVRYLNYNKPEKVTIRGRSYRNYDRDKATAYYHTHDTSAIYGLNSVNLMWDHLSKLVVNCANVLCPFKNITLREDKPPWLTSEIIEILGDRDRAFEEALETKSESTLNEAKKTQNTIEKSATQC